MEQREVTPYDVGDDDCFIEMFLLPEAKETTVERQSCGANPSALSCILQFDSPIDLKKIKQSETTPRKDEDNGDKKEISVMEGNFFGGNMLDLQANSMMEQFNDIEEKSEPFEENNFKTNASDPRKDSKMEQCELTLCEVLRQDFVIENFVIKRLDYEENNFKSTAKERIDQNHGSTENYNNSSGNDYKSDAVDKENDALNYHGKKKIGVVVDGSMRDNMADCQSAKLDSVRKIKDNSWEIDNMGSKCEGSMSKFEDDSWEFGIMASKFQDAGIKPQDTAGKKGKKQNSRYFGDTVSKITQSASDFENTASKFEDSSLQFNNTASNIGDNSRKLQNIASKSEDSSLQFQTMASNIEDNSLGFQNTASNFKDNSRKLQNTASISENKEESKAENPKAKILTPQEMEDEINRMYGAFSSLGT